MPTKKCIGMPFIFTVDSSFLFNLPIAGSLGLTDVAWTRHVANPSVCCKSFKECISPSKLSATAYISPTFAFSRMLVLSLSQTTAAEILNLLTRHKMKSPDNQISGLSISFMGQDTKIYVQWCWFRSDHTRCNAPNHGSRQ